MATKNGKRLTIATIVALATLGLAVGKLIWSASAQSEKLKSVAVEVEKIDPIDKRVTVLETKQDAILKGVESIEKKQNMARKISNI